jgi:hypothetical protein
LPSAPLQLTTAIWAFCRAREQVCFGLKAAESCIAAIRIDRTR